MFYAPDAIDRETALGVKQRASDFDRMEWRQTFLRRRELSAEPIASAVCLKRVNFSPFRSESRRRNMHGLGKRLDAIRAQHRTGPLGIAEILKLTCNRSDPFVENIPGYSARLPQHVSGLFLISPRLVAETAAFAVDLDSALHHRHPCDQDIVRGGDRAMPLIAAKMRQLCTKRFAPKHRVAAVAQITEIESIGYFGNEAADKVRITAIAVAGKDQDITANAFAFAIATNDLDAANT